MQPTTPENPPAPAAPEEPGAAELTSADVPQEDSLATIRTVVKAIAAGHEDTQSLAEKSGVSRRHVGYSINAAIVLGWVEAGEEKLAATDPGRHLLETAPGGIEERALARASILASPVLRILAPDLLADAPPSGAAIAHRIAEATGLSQATSERRARTLLSWRRQAMVPKPKSGR